MANPYSPKPRWDGTHAAAQPAIENNKGYEVTAVRFPDARREQAYGAANSTINNNSYQWPLFVTNIAIDLKLSGKTAQSRLTRDFYPHNFVMPSFTIRGQALDQEDYGNLCEFLHYTQQDSLSSNNLLQLWIKGSSGPLPHSFGLDGGRQGGNKVIITNSQIKPLNQSHNNQVMRGSHQSILCQGYINQMPRAHQKAVVSPTYEFSFVVAEVLDGPYTEDFVAITQQKTWVDILKQTSNLSTDAALKKEAEAAVKYAQANQGNVFNTGQS